MSRVRAVPPADLDVRLDNEANLAALWGALGTALAGVLDLLDVDTVVLGGGYATLAPWLVPAVTAQLRERVLAVGAREVRVMAGRLGPGLRRRERRRPWSGGSSRTRPRCSPDPRQAIPAWRTPAIWAMLTG